MLEKRTSTEKESKSHSMLPTSDLFDWRPFEALRRQMDRFFDEFPSHRRTSDFEPVDRFVTGWQAAPPVDFVEKDKEFEITVELPGLDMKDVEVKLTHGSITVHGEKKVEKEENEQGYYFSERRYGSFKRTFRLPEGIDADKIAASFEKGVLTIRLPKTKELQKGEKTIEIAAK